MICKQVVFVPFLGGFFSIQVYLLILLYLYRDFRPLSRGLFFNDCTMTECVGVYKFSSPFSGTFFNPFPIFHSVNLNT